MRTAPNLVLGLGWAYSNLMAIRILQDHRSSALRDWQDCIEKSLGFRLKWDHLPAGATRCKTRSISHPLPDEAE